MPTVRVRFEQAVYGSFAFWDRGYALLAHSPGCRPEWLAEFLAACQHYGQPRGDSPEARSLFSLRLKSGPWIVVGVSPQGHDDRGRPGALAFHALFLSPRDYRKAGHVPFGLSGALRGDWTAETRTLPSGAWPVEVPGTSETPHDPRALPIAATLARGGRVALEEAGPIDALAREVWHALPDRARRRASVATWAFGNGNRFDLVALPRLAGVELDSSYVDVDPAPSPLPPGEGGRRPGEGPHPGPGQIPTSRPRTWLPSWCGWTTLSALAALAILAGILLGLRGDRESNAPAPVAPTIAEPPAPSSGDEPPTTPDERRRVAEALRDMAERFGVISADSTGHATDPTALMVLLDRNLRYRGPYLSAADRARLEDGRGPDSGHERSLALRWDAHIRRFADDRPLPDDFARATLRRQLATLCWSFHLDIDPTAPRRSPAEIPHALADALAVDLPVRATPLSARYPALASYVEFLGRLPRR